MKAVLVNYNHNPNDWWKKYGLDAIIYDRSDDGIDRTFDAEAVYRTINYGDVDYDKLSYLIDNYDNLPDVFLWGKTNLFKYVDKTSFRETLKKNDYTPLLKKDHQTYSDGLGVVCRYNGDIYEERADSWFFNNPDLSSRTNSWGEWCDRFFLPRVPFIPFAPGGNYILTKERVQRYGVDFYKDLRSTLPYAEHPAEAHACERSYHFLWR